MWDSISNFGSSVWNGIGGWQGVSTGLQAVGTVYDIYNGYQASKMADQYADLAFATAEKQDAFAQQMWDRYKQKYWPLEDLNYEYTMQDMKALRPAYQNQVNYQAQRLNEQLGQAKILNPLIDDTEESLIRKLIEGEDVLAERLRSEATADIGAAFGSQREQDIRAMGLAGINPNSGQMSNYLTKMGQSQALAEAAARTQASRQAEDLAISRQSQALNYAKGAQLPTYQVTPSVNTSNIGTALGASVPSAGLYEQLNKNAQGNYNGANLLLNTLSGGQYGRI